MKQEGTFEEVLLLLGQEVIRVLIEKGSTLEDAEDAVSKTYDTIFSSLIYMTQWNGNSFFDKFYKVQNFFPYAIPIVLDNEPPRM
ncbi:hypothetical protein CF367_RS11945 [Enterococcus hirae]